MKTIEQMRKARADSVKEVSIEKYFLIQAKRYGCRQRKITPYYGPDGWPDRVLVWSDGKGTTDWVELKRPKGGRFEPKQQQVHEDLRACGCRVEVLHTRATVDAYFAARARELGVAPPKPPAKRARLLSAAEYLGI